MSTNPIIENFEQIIRFQNTEQLTPFLLELAKGDMALVRECLKKLRQELDRRDESNNWQAAMTNEQEEMLQLAAIVTFTPVQMLRPPMRFWFAHRYEHRREFWEIMEYVRPTWLADLLLPQARSMDTWGVPYYSFVRKLEQRQLLEFEPELFAKTLPNWLPELGYILSRTEPIAPDSNALVAKMVVEDAAVLTRDLLLLFEFETHVEKARCRIQKIPNSTENWHGRWQEWNQLHPPQGLDWQEVFVRLVDTNHIDRADILTRCLLALRRDFRRPLLTWFKELFLSLKPTRAERLARQAELTELLAHPLPLVVNFAIEQLKDLLPEPGFALAPLLHYADTLLLRPDLRTGLKTLLAGLAKLPKQAATHAPAVARLLAAALAHPDAAVQERAAKGLTDLLAAKKPLLPPAETAEILSTLATQAELLGAAARTVLAPWLAAPTPSPAAKASTAYVPRTQFVPEISVATAIAPVADWHELLFLTGQVLRHDDPGALERWLDGLLRLHGQLPAGYAAQLEPYLVQVLPELKKATKVEAAALLAGSINIWGHDGLLEALLLGWATGFTTPRVLDVDITPTHYARTPLLPLDKLRYAQVEALLQKRQSLPLLSTPTHSPFWVAPSVLLTKLLAYEAADVEPAVGDLLIALARTAHAHPAEAATALQLLPQLQRVELRELLAWYFGSASALPGPNTFPARHPAGLDSPLALAFPELWAVVARTKAPTQVFPALPARVGYDYAGITQPLRPVAEVTTGKNAYQPWPGQPATTHSWTEVHWSSAANGSPPSPLLLYSPPAAKNKQSNWEHNMLLRTDFQFLASLLPNYAAPLYEYVLRSAAWADNLESSERDLVAQALQSLLGPGPVFDPAASAILASGLIHHTPICRSLGQEVLLQAVTNGRLVPAFLGQVLGQQLATGYAPAMRLADNLASVCAISPETDDALAQLFDALLPALPPAPLRNLRKLLETYADLVARTGRAVPPAVGERLREWSQTAALKKLASSLLETA